MKQVVGVVGPCAAGKSTLVGRLSTSGYKARHIAQEHSFVKDMWKRITDPNILIYLHVSYEHTLARRQLNWNEAEYQVQIERLGHARQHADLVVDTDDMSIDEVYSQVEYYLEQQGIHPSSGK